MRKSDNTNRADGNNNETMRHAATTATNDDDDDTDHHETDRSINNAYNIGSTDHNRISTTTLNDGVVVDASVVATAAAADDKALHTTDAQTASNDAGDGALTATVDVVDSGDRAMPTLAIGLDLPVKDNKSIVIDASDAAPAAAAAASSAAPIETESVEVHAGNTIEPPAPTQPAVLLNVNASAVPTAYVTTTNTPGKPSPPAPASAAPAVVHRSTVVAAPLRRPSGVGESADDARHADNVSCRAKPAAVETATVVHSSGTEDGIAAASKLPVTNDANMSPTKKPAPKNYDANQTTQTSFLCNDSEEIVPKTNANVHNDTRQSRSERHAEQPNYLDPAVQSRMQEGEWVVFCVVCVV